jgi:RluA family pseudouridine synthase
MNILHIDNALLVIDKPAGLPVLPDGWDSQAPYIVKLLEADYGRIWIVHRLDKNTSGVLLFARTAEAHRSLNIQFEKHQVRKVYHALAEGNPGWDVHTARHPLRANIGHKHRTAVDNRDGKPSITHFRVLERFKKFVLLEAIPETGRTHQVRVHASELGFPLVGDSLYRSTRDLGLSRPALHALSLAFTHPETGESLTFESGYPEDFQLALTRARTG